MRDRHLCQAAHQQQGNHRGNHIAQKHGRAGQPDGKSLPRKSPVPMAPPIAIMVSWPEVSDAL